MGLCVGLSIAKSASEKGPVALITPCQLKSIQRAVDPFRIEYQYPGFHIPLLPSEVVPHTRTFDLSISVFEKLCNLDFVGNGRPKFDRSHYEGNVHSCVIVLTLSSTSA